MESESKAAGNSSGETSMATLSPDSGPTKEGTVLTKTISNNGSFSERNSSDNEQKKTSSSFPSKSLINSSRIDQLVLKFELDVEEKSKPLKGFILLTLPCGTFPVDLYFYQKKLQKQTEVFLQEYILSANLWTETKASSMKLEKRPEIRHAFYIAAPLLMKDSQKYKIFLKFATVHWIMGEYLRKSSAFLGCMPFLCKGFFTDLIRICRNILSGIYRKAEAVPYFEVPLFHNLLVALYEIYVEIRDCIGHKQYEKYHGPFLREMLDWIESHKLETHNFSGKHNLGYFQGTFLSLKRHLYGRGAILEVIQLLYGASLDESLRETRLFKMLCDTSTLAHAMSLELFGLKWKNGGRSSIERRISSRKESFQKAFQHEVDALNDALMDVQKISLEILKDYPKSSQSYERVQRFVRNVQCFVDGGIRGLAEDWKRSKRGRFYVLKVKA